MDHIDRGGLQTPSPARQEQDTQGGKVDTEALAQLECTGKAELSATADFIAGKLAFDHGNINQARQYFENRLPYQADSSSILMEYAAVLLRTGKFKSSPDRDPFLAFIALLSLVC